MWENLSLIVLLLHFHLSHKSVYMKRSYSRKKSLNVFFLLFYCICIYCLYFDPCVSLTLCRLNEGHTVYLERMIGRAMNGEQFRQFKAMGGWKELQESVRHTQPSIPDYVL